MWVSLVAETANFCDRCVCVCFKFVWMSFLKFQKVGVATPAEPRGEKTLFFVHMLGGEKPFKISLKSASEIFLGGLRGANFFSNTFRIVFRILFRVFQTVFRIDLKLFRGQFRSAGVPP